MYHSDSVKIKQSKFGGKGLFTTKSFKMNQIILSVPQQYFLSYDKLINKHQQVKGITNNKRVQFAICLALQMDNQQSQYQQYFNTIPTQYLNPISQNKQQYSQLQNQAFITKLKNKKQKIIDQINNIIKKIGNAPSLDNILKCFSIVQSRTLFYQTQLDPKSEVGVLVPLYDMANHLEQVNKQNIYNLFYYDKAQQFYILKAYRDYQKNEEVYISYGSYDNQHFIQYYGFIPYNNPNNLKIQVRFHQILSQNNTTQFQNKLKLIQMNFPQFIQETKTLNLSYNAQIYIDSNGQIQPIQPFKILCLKQLNQKYKTIKQLNAAFNILGNNYYSIQQFQLLMDKLKANLLSKYNTTLQFDKQEFKQNKSQFQKLCLEYRILLKSQIQKINVANQ